MKWTLLVKNKRVEEEYPDGWSRGDVMEAAQGRWGGKVRSASLIAASKDRYDYSYDHESDRDDESDYVSDSDYSDSSSSGSGMGFGGLIVAAMAIGGIVMFTGGEDSNYQPATSAPSIQQSFSDITPSKDHPLNFSIRELPKSTPAQYRAEESACDIWRKAQPTLAARLQPGDKCYR